ncbi:MAG: isocitrate lyase/phosphoenolpyruvate mutase family protein [Nitrospinae bacterium]|nr:isocitrate lyase/phosphoenolpyruvate mutase family protein [Nitrospinota bacterium]
MAGKDLRNLLDNQKLVFPGAYNAFSAKQIAQEGFPGIYISGAGLANGLGVPDDGTLKIEDFLYLGRWIVQAVDVPVVCDADTGFENAEDTVRKYIEVGLSGLHIEDQVFPKKCGHLPGKEIIPRNEMVDKITKACAARDSHDPDFVIIARTDARGAANIDEPQQFEESVTRGNLYREAGAEIIFPESLRSKGEFARYRKEVDGYLLANMTEFGKTPFISAREFMDLGYNIIIFPVSLFRYHAGQTKMFLSRLKQEGTQQHLVQGMMDRAEINGLLDYKG